MKKAWLCLFILLAIFLSLIFDGQIVSAIAQSRTTFFDGAALWFTSPLTIIIIFFVMASFFLWGEHKRKWIVPLWASVSLSAFITLLLKILVQRTRPFETLALPLVQGTDYAFSFWNSSFPSLHASIVFSLTPILLKEFPKLKWFWIALALLISFSRIYIGVHYLSDVLAGCLMGLLIGNGIIILEKRGVFQWKKKKN